MAISHIPRSVGHNFVPEYQISAVPYIIDLDIESNITKKKYIKRDADNFIVGETTESGAGVDLVKSFGRVEDDVLFDDVSDRTVDGLKATFSATGVVQMIELPKISNWIQFLPKTGNANGIEFAFSRKDILNAGGNTGNIIKVTDNFNPGNDSVQNQFYLKPLNIRCSNIYLTTNGDQGKLLVGLTTIDRSEFTEVVETFLEVD
jgi:hypothetical protein